MSFLFSLWNHFVPIHQDSIFFKDDAVVDFLEQVIDKGYLQQWTNARFNVTHNKELLSQATTVADIEGITIEEPLMIRRWWKKV